MKIVFCCRNTDPEPWLAGLTAALPGAEVLLWEPGGTCADHAVVWAPPQEFFDQQPQLRGVFNIGAGVDALLALRLPASALVVRLDDAGMAVQMAEYVCQAVIRYFRQLDVYAQDIDRGQWTFQRPQQRADFAVGVMGLGVLGSRVAHALRHFEFPVRGWSRLPKVQEGVQTYHGLSQLNDFLASCRVLVNLLPLTPDTVNILNRHTLGQLQSGAYLINVARGAHLVDEDLLTLLDSGQLDGATLDVFRTEPLPSDHPFWRHHAITITPHTSARTLRDASIAQIAAKIQAMERGERVAGLVDVLRGY